MKILEHTKLANGSFIVLRQSREDEFVTGMIPAHQVPDSVPADRTEHCWGHYFDSQAEAREDYIARIRRGY